jgi:hypothetical protein
MDGSAVAPLESLRELPLLLAQQGTWTKGELLPSSWPTSSKQTRPNPTSLHLDILPADPELKYDSVPGGSGP